ncbi:MAG TPA: UDP-N-acetylmuramoyl-tripeptide--D-alanyl-D-alanine ligase [Candidatus Polarisedimenticolia bacterium]|nr:UDP-N-acetylmuramoyl-tripeptide--D-alanyl-D-alanine ligase [Candidatus Polarisedimenticolia bacterium]
MARLSLEAIAGAVRGQVTLGARPPEQGAQHRVEGYSIDSRSVGPGDLFFAIVGPRLDGHDFVNEAVTRGAVAAVVARGGPGTYPQAPALVRVADTTRALQELGAHVRRMRPLKVVGITGSAGKTTAKEMTGMVLSRRFLTERSEGNLNNTYGLPLTLARLHDDRQVAVLEMGMSTRGEIARLAEIADPDVGVILNVLRVHLEHFGSLAKIAAAKGELFQGMRRDAVAIYNADDRHAARLGAAFPGRRLAFGLETRKADLNAAAITAEGLDATRFTLRRGREQRDVRLRIAGRHNVYNALAAAAVGTALDLDLETIAAGLETFAPAAMRGVLHRLAGGPELLDDSYNSNPAAMEKAIALLSEATPRGRRVLVAGDMLELGPYGTRAHTLLGEQVAASGLDLFVAVGPLCRRAADAARAHGAKEVRHFDDSQTAAPFVAEICRAGDLLLVKGSRGMRMERVVQAVLARFGVTGKGGGH